MVDAFLDASSYALIVAFVLALLAVLTSATKRNYAIFLANASTGSALASIALALIAITMHIL